MNVIADTVEHAASELRDLLTSMLIEVSMQFPLTQPAVKNGYLGGLIESLRCDRQGCPFIAQSREHLETHNRAMHP